MPMKSYSKFKNWKLGIWKCTMRHLRPNALLVIPLSTVKNLANLLCILLLNIFELSQFLSGEEMGYTGRVSHSKLLLSASNSPYVAY